MDEFHISFARKEAEEMNPKRGMWVRFIRSLRLAEYARRKGFEHLEEILDVARREIIWLQK